MLNLSRAAFYEHVRKGNFVAPVYSLATRRPIYTAELQSQNLEVRATQIGVNGEFVLFYERQPRDQVGERPAQRRRSAASGAVASEFRRRLEGLGLTGLTDARVEQAVASCFPRGTAGVVEADVLRVVYRFLRRSDHV
jgi:hypothetical protein